MCVSFGFGKALACPQTCRAYPMWWVGEPQHQPGEATTVWERLHLRPFHPSLSTPAQNSLPAQLLKVLFKTACSRDWSHLPVLQQGPSMEAGGPQDTAKSCVRQGPARGRADTGHPCCGLHR